MKSTRSSRLDSLDFLLVRRPSSFLKEIFNNAKCPTGAVYGGVLGSRKSYMDFMERNQATAFENHLDAKRKLQDQVTTGFAKNAFRFGWRLGLFTTSYT